MRNLPLFEKRFRQSLHSYWGSRPQFDCSWLTKMVLFVNAIPANRTECDTWESKMLPARDTAQSNTHRILHSNTFAMNIFSFAFVLFCPRYGNYVRGAEASAGFGTFDCNLYTQFSLCGRQANAHRALLLFWNKSYNCRIYASGFRRVLIESFLRINSWK